MFHTYVQRFDFMRNFENFCKILETKRAPINPITSRGRVVSRGVRSTDGSRKRDDFPNRCTRVQWQLQWELYEATPSLGWFLE